MKKIILLLAVAVASISCDDDIRPDHEFTTSAKAVGFSEEFTGVSYFADEGQVQKDFPVDVIGGGDGMPFSTDTQVSYEIDPSSTATEGVEFNFIDNTGKVNIPAGQTFGNFSILVNTGSLNPTQKTELIINLTTSTNGAIVSDANRQFKIIFIGCQSQVGSSTGGAYTTTVTRNDGIVRVYPNDYIYTTSVNNFKTTLTGTYGPGQLAPATDQGYNFTDICGDITIPNQNLAQGFYSNTVTGTNSYNGNDGVVNSINNFQTKYEISFAAGPRQYVNNYVR